MNTSLPVDHPRDVGWVDPKMFSYACLGLAAFPSLPYETYLLVGQFYPASVLSNSTSSLGHAVSAIVGVGAKEQVRWPNARRSVAFVAYKHSGGDSPEVDNPRGSVSWNDFGLRAPRGNTVSPFVTTSLPQPATIRDFNFVPKSPQERFGKSLSQEEFSPIVRPLNQVHFAWVTLPEVTGLAGATF